MIRPLLLGLALLAGAPAALAAEPAAVTAADRVLGRADAPVTVVEYSSFTCPHCAAWTETVLPAFKARFVDTGQVRFVYRDLPTNPAPVSTLAAKVSRCVAPDKAFAVIELLMAQQEAARLMRYPQGWFVNAIEVGGRPPEEVVACVEDAATQTALDAQVADARAAGVTGTPSFFVNGRRVEDTTLDGLATAIEPLLP
jgi:protein-disulfide isomerase